MEKIKEFFKNVKIDINKISLILIMLVIFAPLITTVMRLFAVNNFFIYKMLYIKNIDISLYTTYTVGYIGVAAFIYLCVSKGISHWKKYASSKLLIPLYMFIAFLIWLLFSCLFAQDTHIAFYGSEYRNEGYYLYLAYAGVCFLSMLIQHDKKKIIYNSIIFVAMFLAIMGFVDFPGKERVFTYWNSIAAIFTNPNHYGYFLVIPIICSVLLLENEKWYLKIIYLISYVTLLLTLINTATSGSYIAIFITIIAILIYQIITKKKWSFSLLALAIFMVCTFSYNSAYSNEPMIADIKSIADQAVSITGNEKENIVKLVKEDEIKNYSELDKDQKAIANYGSRRVLIWINSLKLIKQKPMIGYGLENISQDMIGGGGGRPHNLILQMCLFAGIPGAMLYLIGIAIIMIRGLINFKLMDIVTSISYFACFGYLISAMFGNTMYYTSPFFLVFFGMLYGKEIRQYFIQ